MTKLSLAADHSFETARAFPSERQSTPALVTPFASARSFSGATTIISGIVERGRQLGRLLGFPTANVALPSGAGVGFGVYAVRSRLADGREMDGVASLGCNPTVPKTAPVLEVWLFDFDEDIYDQLLTTELVVFLRGEEKFDTMEDLKVQVLRDAATAKRILQNTPASVR
jgi:riboflavin kinase/FMN adenylyltransferase